MTSPSALLLSHLLHLDIGVQYGLNALRMIKLAGLRILKVSRASIGERAGLERFFDFVMALDSVNFSDSNFSRMLEEAVRSRLGQCVTLRVFNALSENFRSLSIFLDGDLGISCRFTALDALAVGQVERILPDSPAQKVGLCMTTDFIMSCRPLPDDDGTLKLIIYNIMISKFRKIFIRIQKQIICDDFGEVVGVGSAIGCIIKRGSLSMIESERKMQHQFVVDIMGPPPSDPPPAPPVNAVADLVGPPPSDPPPAIPAVKWSALCRCCDASSGTRGNRSGRILFA